MKTTEEAWVIIKQHGEQFDFFQNYISFDKNEIEAKCSELNEKTNERFKKHSTLGDNFIPLTIYTAVNLKDAIEKFRDCVADHYRVEDESL